MYLLLSGIDQSTRSYMSVNVFKSHDAKQNDEQQLVKVILGSIGAGK